VKFVSLTWYLLACLQHISCTSHFWPGGSESFV
jgi:hypothetical protein